MSYRLHMYVTYLNTIITIVKYLLITFVMTEINV
jgi:hypothetical protein